MPGKMVCFAHDPELRTQRHAWTTAAGKAKSNARRLKKSLGLDAATLTLTEVDALLCAALKGVLTGKIEPGIATSAATVSKAITSVRSLSTLEERLTQLEQRAGIQVSA